MKKNVVGLVLLTLPLWVLGWHPRPTLTEASAATSSATSPGAELSSPQGNELVTLRTVLAGLYMTNGTKEVSAVARVVIGHRLRTNESFRVWGTNAVKAAIEAFATNSEVRFIGLSPFDTNALTIQAVMLDLSRGLVGQAIYDPHPDREGPTEILVVGSTNPVISMIRNAYAMQAYQIDPSLVGKGTEDYPRLVPRADWSGAKQALNQKDVEGLARRAFKALTGNTLLMELASQVRTGRVIDRSMSHPEVQVTGQPGAMVYGKDAFRFPFAEFEFGEAGSAFRPFSGQLFQDAPSQGIFVKLYLVRPNDPDALFDLWRTFSPSAELEAKQVLTELRDLDSETRIRLMRELFSRRF